jgi:glycosyltransferase involved in cell wall biosynthesis
MKKLKSLSIFFPAYNDENSIDDLVKKAYRAGTNLTEDLEVIVVNDGSNDATEKVLQKLKQQYTSLKIITHKKNQGYGAALRDGFTHTSKEWVFYTDGDGQYDPSEVSKLVDTLSDKIDVVNGYKIKRDDSKVRIIIGKMYNSILQKLYSLPVSDVDCDFRLIRRSFLQKIQLKSDTGVICLELLIKLRYAGARFAEVGVHHYKRKFGHSQFFTFKNLKKTFIDHLFFYFRHKIVPIFPSYIK